MVPRRHRYRNPPPPSSLYKYPGEHPHVPWRIALDARYKTARPWGSSFFERPIGAGSRCSLCTSPARRITDRQVRRIPLNGTRLHRWWRRWRRRSRGRGRSAYLLVLLRESLVSFFMRKENRGRGERGPQIRAGMSRSNWRHLYARAQPPILRDWTNNGCRNPAFTRESRSIQLIRDGVL